MPYAAGETGTAFEEGYAFQQDLTVAQAGLERAFLRKPGQVKPELVPLLAQVLVLVVPVQVVLILAAPVHPVTVTGNTHR